MCWDDRLTEHGKQTYSEHHLYHDEDTGFKSIINSRHHSIHLFHEPLFLNLIIWMNKDLIKFELTSLVGIIIMLLLNWKMTRTLNMLVLIQVTGPV